MGERLTAGLGPVVDRTPWIAELRGRGLMRAVEMVHPGTIEPDAARAGAVLEACRTEGLLVGKGGLYGNCLRIAPMLNVSEAEIDEGVAALTAAISATR
jgi:4-aminobutyrate aminotransferase